VRGTSLDKYVKYSQMNPKTKIKLARKLRRTMTDAEQKLWYRLRGRRLNAHKFRRQVPIDRYIVDFLCESAKLIVELDGGQHGEMLEQDDIRTKALQHFGYHVIRFWNNDVFENIDGVLQGILDEINLRG